MLRKRMTRKQPGLNYDPNLSLTDALDAFAEIQAGGTYERVMIRVYEGAGSHKLGRINFTRMGDLAQAFREKAEGCDHLFDGVVGANSLTLAFRHKGYAAVMDPVNGEIPDEGGDFVLQRFDPLGDDTGRMTMEYMNMQARQAGSQARLIRRYYPEGHNNLVNYTCPDFPTLVRLCQLTSSGSRLGAWELRGRTPPGVS